MKIRDVNRYLNDEVYEKPQLKQKLKKMKIEEGMGKGKKPIEKKKWKYKEQNI